MLARIHGSGGKAICVACTNRHFSMAPNLVSRVLAYVLELLAISVLLFAPVGELVTLVTVVTLNSGYLSLYSLA